jgi:hypothetical protein
MATRKTAEAWEESANYFVAGVWGLSEGERKKITAMTEEDLWAYADLLRKQQCRLF